MLAIFRYSDSESQCKFSILGTHFVKNKFWKDQIELIIQTKHLLIGKNHFAKVFLSSKLILFASYTFQNPKKIQKNMLLWNKIL